MIYLHRLRVENFRSLRKVDVPLRGLNVLVGPNGAGKTNLLKVIQFLGDIARLDLRPAISEHGGLEAITFRGAAKRRRIVIEVEAQVTEYSSKAAHDVYTLAIWPFNTDEGRTIIRRNENLVFKRTRGRGRRIKVSGGRFEVLDEGREPRKRSLSQGSAGLSTLQKLGDDEGALQVGQLAELFETFRVFEIDVARARLPSPEISSSTLAQDASNLAAFLLWLQARQEDVYTALLEDLAYVVTGFEGLQTRLVGGAQEAVELSIVERGLPGSTRLADASFGTIRAIALLAMLHDPNPPQLTCVEEIDHGLHPYALDVIVERLRSASKRTQLLVATHSPALVNRLRPDELIVCERDADGGSLIPAVDAAEIQSMASAADLRLGELWFSGALGGVP